jgi:hypothetical protein
MEVFEIDSLQERIRLVVERLLELEQPALARLSGRRPDPVRTYLGLLGELAVVDLTGSGGAAFRTRFNGYYGVRRNEAWRGRFYRSFEWAKTSGLGDPLSAARWSGLGQCARGPRCGSRIAP